MDYQNRDKLNLIALGLKYLFSENHIVEAEHTANTFVFGHGMAD